MDDDEDLWDEELAEAMYPLLAEIAPEDWEPLEAYGLRRPDLGDHTTRVDGDGHPVG